MLWLAWLVIPVDDDAADDEEEEEEVAGCLAFGRVIVVDCGK